MVRHRQSPDFRDGLLQRPHRVRLAALSNPIRLSPFERGQILREPTMLRVNLRSALLSECAPPLIAQSRPGSGPCHAGQALAAVQKNHTSPFIIVLDRTMSFRVELMGQDRLASAYCSRAIASVKKEPVCVLSHQIRSFRASAAARLSYAGLRNPRPTAPESPIPPRMRRGRLIRGESLKRLAVRGAEVWGLSANRKMYRIGSSSAVSLRPSNCGRHRRRVARPGRVGVRTCA